MYYSKKGLRIDYQYFNVNNCECKSYIEVYLKSEKGSMFF